MSLTAMKQLVEEQAIHMEVIENKKVPATCCDAMSHVTRI